MTTDNPLRTPVIAGNWKMHKSPEEAAAFVKALAERLPASNARSVLLFPPALDITSALAARADRRDLLIGVQNIHWKPEGAFTGEISAPMARAAGAEFALVGHSERRHVFGETEEETRKKVAAAFEAGLTPVLCLGETLEQRRAGSVEEVCLGQLAAAAGPLDEDRLRTLVIAYEPVWAIGTGETATPDDAAGAHGSIRSWLRERLGEDAGRVPVLYGGSVKPTNARELLDASDVDGVLVGGASLDPDSFAAIAEAG